MFRNLTRNILITGMAYSVISLVGLLLAPFLIAAYTLAGYGQILLARLFLPSTSFGFIDLGIGESATRAIATASSTKDWSEASRVITLLAAIALAISTCTAVLIAACAWHMPIWMGIEDGQRVGFTHVLLITAALQPMLFLSLVAEGTLKGFEKFKLLRSCEIAAALIYGGLAVALVTAGFGPNWVAAALLFGLTIRFLMAASYAVSLLRKAGVSVAKWHSQTRQEVARWSRVMFANKILGTLQTQIAAPLIGFLIGPAAVGAYDAVIRLPRFAKMIFSLLSATVLPVAAGLKAQENGSALRRLGGYGILGALIVSTPPIIFSMAYSEKLLQFWIGEEVAQFWIWQSAMFLVALLNIALSFGGSILLADRDASASLNRLSLLQVCLQVLISLGFIGVFEEWSFVLGHAVSVSLLFPFQLASIRRALSLDRRLIFQFALIAGVALVSALLLRIAVPEPNLLTFICLGVIYTLAIMSLSPWLLLTRDERIFFSGRARLILAPAAVGGSGGSVSARTEE